MKKSIIMFLLMGPLIGFGQAKKYFRQAQRASDLKEKIALFTQVIDLEPKNWDAYFHRALAKNNSSDFNGAIVDYSRVIVEEPDADSYYNRGNSRYSLKDFKGAKEDYTKSCLLDENFIDALYSLACVKFDLKLYDAAIEDFTSLIKKNPDFSEFYLLRAAAYKALKNYQKALSDYNKAILRNPSVDTFYNRGLFMLDIKYFKEAKIDFTKVLRVDKNNAYGYFYRGVSNMFLGYYSDAISDFTKVLKYDSMDFDAYLGLAIAYHKMNNLTKTKSNFDQANSIISPTKNINSIEKYTNTYWHEKHYYYFNNSINALRKIK